MNFSLRLFKSLLLGDLKPVVNPGHSKNWWQGWNQNFSPPLLRFAHLTTLVGIPLKLVPSLRFFPTLVVVDISELEDEMNMMDSKHTACSECFFIAWAPLFLVRDTPIVECPQSGKNWNLRAQMSGVSQSLETGFSYSRFLQAHREKVPYKMFGWPGRDDWFCGSHTGGRYSLGPCGMELNVL